jgi:uncharacterized protein (TIGR03435 family)
MVRAASLLILTSYGVFCQTPAGAPVFEAASIKPGDPDSRGVSFLIAPGGRLTTKNTTLKMLMTFAYDIRDFQVSGGPNWLDSARYDIVAKPENALLADPGTLTLEQFKTSEAQFRLMVQGLLADRFQLKFHRETKDLPVYALVLDKNGTKLKENTETGLKNTGLRITARGQVTCMKTPMELMVQFLSNQLGRTVLNKTGLTGNYDFKLEWTPDPGQGNGPFGGGPDAPPPPDPNGPSIFTAVQEQLGLKLESQKGPVEILVIDHVEKASEN